MPLSGRIAVSEQPSPSVEVPTPKPSLVFQISTDVALTLAVLTYLSFQTVVKPWLAKKVEKASEPIEGERRIQALLAQMGILTEADRVVLGVFHNGHVTYSGYHLTRMSVMSVYVAPGRMPLASHATDVPIGRIVEELEQMRDSPSGWVTYQVGANLPLACKQYLEKEGMMQLDCRLLFLGSLPIGAIGIQYVNPGPALEAKVAEKYRVMLDDLCSQVGTILLKRAEVSSPLLDWFARILGRRTVRIDKTPGNG